jgi:hypothetical protein
MAVTSRSRVSSWRLDSRHRLVRYSQRGSIQTLAGEIISCDDSSLTFEISSRDTGGNDHLRVLKLGGRWQADEQNRLTFLVNDNRDDGCLVFRNGWQLNRSQEIVYTFEDSATGRRHSFCLHGRWKFSSAEQIAYVLGRGLRSLAFRCQVESLSLYPARAKIKFRVGVGRSGDLRANGIFIFGAWKFSRSLGIEIQAGPQGAIELAADINAGARNTIQFALRDSRRRPLGVTIGLTHRFLKNADGRAWLKIRRLGRENTVETGVTVPF